jgi:ribonuclease HI
MKRPIITLFTDAGFHPPSKIGSWAAWAKFSGGEPLRRSGLLRGEIRDSGLAEYKALANGLVSVIRFFSPPPKTLILCHTDCDELVYQLNRLSAPTTNEPKRRLVLNYVRRLQQNTETIIYGRHVSGHKGNRTSRNAANTWCDSECTKHLAFAKEDLAFAKEEGAA